MSFVGLYIITLGIESLVWLEDAERCDISALSFSMDEEVTFFHSVCFVLHFSRSWMPTVIFNCLHSAQ